ncbi:MAG: hypothetical protein JO295_13740 [Verrucomicrobia bacterium]|nr:hypothetical protein [Verrucomicrobiota bacterium]
MKSKVYELAHAVPFQPFIILMADGRNYRVPSADHILVTQNPRTYIVVETDDGKSTSLPSLLISGVTEQRQTA